MWPNFLTFYWGSSILEHQEWGEMENEKRMEEKQTQVGGLLNLPQENSQLFGLREWMPNSNKESESQQVPSWWFGKYGLYTPELGEQWCVWQDIFIDQQDIS